MLPTDVPNNGNGSGHVAPFPSLAEFCAANPPAPARPAVTLAYLSRSLHRAHDRLKAVTAALEVAVARVEEADKRLARVGDELDRRTALKRRRDARYRAHKRQEVTT